MIGIFRKVDEGTPVYPSKVKAAVLAPMLALLTATCRVKRPELLSFLLPTPIGRSEFARLTAVTRSELHHLADCRREGVMTDEAEATLSKAWVVPESCLGRAPKSGERDWPSTAQSILLWSKKVGTYSLSESDVHTVDPSGADISVIVLSD